MSSFRKPLMPLISNGFKLSSAPNRLGPLNPSQSDLTIEEYRRLFHLQGYIWIKGFFERNEVLEMRRRFFDAYRDTGLLLVGSNPEEGLFSGNAETELNQKILMEFVRTAAYESFCLQPKLWQFYDNFFGSPSYLH